MHDGSPRITGRQLRAARGLLGLSAEKFASYAGVSHATIKRAEAAINGTQMIPQNEAAVIAALHRLGVLLLESGPSGDVGVRLMRESGAILAQRSRALS